MGWEYSVSFDDTRLLGVLDVVARRSLDLRPAMDEIGAMLQTSTDMRFERGVDPAGRPWAPLATSTVKRKAKAGRERMLQWSGRLRQSITRKADNISVTVGTNLSYAAAHQFGTDITRYAQSREVLRQYVTSKSGRKELLPGFAKRSKANFASWHEVAAHVIRIPARPFLGITRDDREAGADILKRFLIGGVR